MSNRFISWAIFILLCLIWGSSFILMKAGKEGLTATQIAALRICSASIVFLPFAVFHIARLPRKKIPVIILSGLTGNLIPAFLFAAAVFRMDSSLVGILNSLTPICVVVLGILLFRDKIGSKKIAGVLVGFAGLCLLTFTQEDVSLDNLGYASLVIMATLSYGLNVNMVSHYLKGIHPVQAASVSLAFLFVPTLLILWWDGFFRLDFSDGVIRWSILASVLLGIVGSAIATALFYILVQKAGGLFASLVTYGIPFVALIWGIIYGETVTLKEIGCLAIILSGVYLANRPEKPAIP
jgi:drug/metabolite transporter (DMT)-like permease